MATQAQYKTRGILLVVSFFAILVLIFMPVFPGPGKKVNGLDYLDNFFNELSKGSANYIKAERTKAEAYNGKDFSATLKLKTEKDAQLASKILYFNGAASRVVGTEVEVTCRDLGSLISGMLDDAEAMYNNQGEVLEGKYKADGKRAFYTWYLVLSALEKDFTKNSKFAEAKFIKGTMSKAVEPAYNYYGVEGKSVKAEMFLLIGALLFYVIYTVWYGFGLLYLFEGMGINLEH